MDPLVGASAREGRTPFIGHVRATALKNLTLLKRQKMSLVCQLLLPLIIVIVGGSLILYINSTFGGDFRGKSSVNWSLQDIATDPLERGRYVDDRKSKNVILGSLVQSRYGYNARREGFFGFMPSITYMDTPNLLTVFNGTPNELDLEILRQGNLYSDLSSQEWSTNYTYADQVEDRFQVIVSGVNVSTSSLHATVQLAEENTWAYRSPYPSGPKRIDMYSLLFSTLGSAKSMRADCVDEKDTERILQTFNSSEAYHSIGTSGRWTTYGTLDITSFGSFLMCWMLPIAFGFSLPLFVFNLVSEKTTRAIEMMKIMGMNMTAYWFSSWLFYSLVTLAISILLCIVGLCLQIQFFLKPNAVSWILLLVINSFSQPVVSMILSTFFQRPRIANAVVYLLTLVFFGGIQALNIFVFNQDYAPWYLMWITPFAFVRGIYIICASMYNPFSSPLSFHEIWSGELFMVYLWMIGFSIIFFALTVYLENVLPKEHGIREPVWFPITRLMGMFRGGDNIDERTPLNSSYPRGDVIQSKDVVVVRDIRKEFPGKTALNGVSLSIPKGECLGLLGPNGAGKSTLAHILSGIISPSGGEASIAGRDIATEMYMVRKVMGFCPQHEIVWESLTVEEHLLFYLRVKGVDREFEYSEAERILASVGLLDAIDKTVSQLSGGMKRRLSIAISLVGNPKCLILDEPTTGLDPDTRRSIWEMIQSQKEGRAIILTTHNMEEADTLSSRVAIVSNGELVCLGTPLDLKRQYGRGYKLSVSVLPQRSIDVDGYIRNMFPRATHDPVSADISNYYIPTEDVNIGRLFGEMKRNKDAHGILEWGISQASLEEVFIKVLQEEDTSV